MSYLKQLALVFLKEERLRVSDPKKKKFGKSKMSLSTHIHENLPCFKRSNNKGGVLTSLKNRIQFFPAGQKQGGVLKGGGRMDMECSPRSDGVRSSYSQDPKY